MNLSKLILLAATAVLILFPSAAFAVEPVNESPQGPVNESKPVGAYISIHTAKDRNHLGGFAKSEAKRQGAISYLVFSCSHPGRRPDVVTCKVRLRFRDKADGVRGFHRYIGTATTRHMKLVSTDQPTG